MANLDYNSVHVEYNRNYMYGLQIKQYQQHLLDIEKAKIAKAKAQYKVENVKLDNNFYGWANYEMPAYLRAPIVNGAPQEPDQVPAANPYAAPVPKVVDPEAANYFPLDAVGAHYPRDYYEIVPAEKGISYSAGITVAGMISGCGVAQCRGLGYLKYDKTNPIHVANLEKMKASMKTKGAGAIVGTLGSAFRERYEQCVLDMGFVECGVYSNYQHDRTGTEKQKMYMLHL